MIQSGIDFDSISQALQNNVASNLSLYCKSSNPISKICCSFTCEAQSLHCNLQGCQTCKNSAHEFCSTLDFSKWVKILGQRAQRNKKSLKQFIEMEKKIILKLMQLRDSVLQIINFSNLQSKHFNKLRQTFINKKCDLLKGKQSLQITERLKNLHHEELELNIKDILLQFSKKAEKLVEDYQTLKLETILSIFPPSGQNIISYIQPELQSKIDSIIIENDQEKKLLVSWLEEPIKLQLVFRASKHGFSSSKFHQICDSVTHNLVLIKNEFGKKIGGYTPLKWNSSSNGTYAKDSSGKSFIFSLNMKQKMRLTMPQNTIICYSGFGPTFGGYDICISDQCNLNNNSYSNFPHSFSFDQKYVNKQVPVTIFCGNRYGNKFKVMQYEVFKVLWK